MDEQTRKVTGYLTSLGIQWFLDAKGTVWELAKDPFHPCVLATAGPRVAQAIGALPDSEPEDVWLKLDYWGNEVGVLRGSNPPGYPPASSL
jgi:hypothetical protein